MLLRFSNGTRMLAAALSLFAAPLHAQQRDPAAAQALFDEATRLTKQGRYPEACEKLAESNRLDPGIGTQFHLADCYEQSGRFASAWAGFLEVASQARASGQSDRERAALARAAKLEARLPKLQIDVPEASRAQGLEVRRDGVVIGSAQWGTPVPVDPGDHTVVMTAPGKMKLARTVHSEVGKAATFTVPVLDDAEPDESAAAPAAVVATPVASNGDADSPKSSGKQGSTDEGASGGGPSPVVYVLAGVGVVGLGVGTAFAVMASSTNKDSKAECQTSNPNLCSQAGVDMRNDALAQGNIATVGFVVGGAALAGAGLMLLLDGGSAEKPSKSALAAGVNATPGGAGLFLKGGF